MFVYIDARNVANNIYTLWLVSIFIIFYLEGKFILKTDHKFLIIVFKEHKEISNICAHRLHKCYISFWVFIGIQFFKGSENSDTLTRLTLIQSDKISYEQDDNFFIHLITSNIKYISHLVIYEDIFKDTVPYEVFNIIYYLFYKLIFM